MKDKFLGIFGKVFLYTMLILILIISGMFLFFSNQIKSTVMVTQQRQVAEVFQPLFQGLREKTNEEMVEFAREFHEKNRSFDFRIETEDGEILFQTENFKMPAEMENPPGGKFIIRENLLNPNRSDFSVGRISGRQAFSLMLTMNGIKLYVSSLFTGASVYVEILEQAAWIFGLVFAGSLIAAAFFARRIAKPIQDITADTHKMSLLEPVDAPCPRKDEIGQLAEDVYAMYSKLKATIHQLETEIEHEKMMEENQRYFFSAASHELKTPIAAIGAILEGMLNDVIPPEEHRAYLHDCMKLIGEQSRLVSEILDIVKLSGEISRQEKDRIRLKECVNGILTQFVPMIEAKGQRLTMEIDEEITTVLDAGLFAKVLSNVILNGMQNSPTGGEIRIFAKEKKSHIRFRVWNSDTQIPADFLPKLFEPFYRTDEGRTSSEGRSGLGLTIVKKALDLMEIPFKVENSEGGVLFQIELPKE